MSANFRGPVTFTTGTFSGAVSAASATSSGEVVNLGQLDTTIASGSGQPYDIGGGFSGKGTSSQIICQYVSPRGLTFPANLAASAGPPVVVASTGTATASATAATTYTITVSGTAVGTVSWAASGFTPTFATTGGTSFTVTAGQVLTITGPSTADTTLANVSITLAGYIT